jgi:flagellar basal body rod protein FlgG
LDGKNNRDYHISGRFQVNGYGLLVGKEGYLVWTTYENNSKATESNAIMAGGI